MIHNAYTMLPRTWEEDFLLLKLYYLVDVLFNLVSESKVSYFQLLMYEIYPKF